MDMSNAPKQFLALIHAEEQNLAMLVANATTLLELCFRPPEDKEEWDLVRRCVFYAMARTLRHMTPDEVELAARRTEAVWRRYKEEKLGGKTD